MSSINVCITFGLVFVWVQHYLCNDPFYNYITGVHHSHNCLSNANVSVFGRNIKVLVLKSLHLCRCSHFLPLQFTNKLRIFFRCHEEHQKRDDLADNCDRKTHLIGFTLFMGELFVNMTVSVSFLKLFVKINEWFYIGNIVFIPE